MTAFHQDTLKEMQNRDFARAWTEARLERFVLDAAEELRRVLFTANAATKSQIDEAVLKVAQAAHRVKAYREDKERADASEPESERLVKEIELAIGEVRMWIAQAAGECPDTGACHHDCERGSCFRVRCAGPLSIAKYPGDRWPADVVEAMGNPPSQPSIEDAIVGGP